MDDQELGQSYVSGNLTDRSDVDAELFISIHAQ